MTKYAARLNFLRRYGLKYADLPADTFGQLKPVALELTKIESTELFKRLISSKNLPKSSSSQRELHTKISLYL